MELTYCLRIGWVNKSQKLKKQDIRDWIPVFSALKFVQIQSVASNKWSGWRKLKRASKCISSDKGD